MKMNLITIAVSAALLTMGAASVQAATAQEQTLEELSRYTEHRRDVVISGESFSFLKLNYDGRMEQVAVDEKGSLLDPEEVLKLNRERFAKYGSIHPHLYQAMQQGGDSFFDVFVLLNIDTSRLHIAKPIDVPRGAEEKYEAALAAEYGRAAKKFADQRRGLLDKLGLKGLAEDGMEASPFVRTQLSRGEIEDLSRNSLVRMLMLRDGKGIDDLDDAMDIANADEVHATGITGTEVKVAIFEGAPDDTTNLDIEDSYSASIGAAPASTSTHAQHVTAIIKNLNAVSGFAPDSLTYSADDYDLVAFDWAVDNIRVSVINQSFHRNAEINDGLSSDDLYKDYKVLQYPWPTVVHAAGNWCGVGSSCYEMGSDVTDEFVNHKGFNTISIGNHNDTASEMSASSCFINPSSAHNDRELPELSANGTSVDADGMVKSGTSMSSPAVVGSVALLQDKVSTLRYWPEANRALLFAGARNNVDKHAGQLSGGGDAADAPNYWWDDVNLDHDGFDGAGALNIHESVKIAEHRWDGSAGNRGWDIGYMNDDDFDGGNNYEETWTVRPQSSSPLFTQPHIRVALAWNSTATVDGSGAAAVYASELGMDLDIRVYNSSGAQVAYSLSWDNSYEIVDFDAKEGETYTIKINRWSADASDWSWYGIAWDTYWNSPVISINPDLKVPALVTIPR